MKVGILGSGDVAKSLGEGFLSRGHEVMLGTRDASKLADWQKERAGAKVGSFSDAAKFGDTIALATMGTATLQVIELAGAANFSGKVVIDATNPLLFESDGVRLSVGFDDSLGEQVQRAIREAKVVKAFNTVGHGEFVDPKFEGGPPTMFIGGNDDAAKETVSKILRSFGWDVADLGGIEASRYLEPMCMAWVLYAVQAQNRHHAFKLLR
ncbi:MAG: NAD(P)-binding domain-containing protein [Candidatus Eremiobacteraeota bacterium]|nr:NAD(P)-binding domain-containing protein [Candidatus Eremiobacteraeota bacterium]MBV8435728.1 NAD(P)-binding domain-containing protein [Candidatus Eremiobacteraeota bacterium]